MDEEDVIPDLDERVEELESQLLKMQHIIRFHGLDKIHRKYRKAFVTGKEYPFFEAPGFKKEPTQFEPFGETHLHKMPDAEEREQAKQRMLNYAVPGKRYFSRDDDEIELRRIKEEEYHQNRRRQMEVKPKTSEEPLNLSHLLERIRDL